MVSDDPNVTKTLRFKQWNGKERRSVHLCKWAQPAASAGCTVLFSTESKTVAQELHTAHKTGDLATLQSPLKYTLRASL